jgi:gametocyte-specific factor 1
MATFIEKNAEKLLTCPFNQNHKVKPIRYQQHIIKCEKTSQIKLETCPFIASHKISKEEFDQHVANCPGKTNVLPQIKSESVSTFKDKPTLYNQENDWESTGPGFVATGLRTTKVTKKLIASKHLNPITIQRLSKFERKRLYAERVELLETHSKLQKNSPDNSAVESINKPLTSQPFKSYDPEPELHFWSKDSLSSAKTSDSFRCQDCDFPSLSDSKTRDLSETRYFKLIPSDFSKMDKLDNQPLLVWPNSQAYNQAGSTLRQSYTEDLPCGPSIKKEQSFELESPCEPSLKVGSSYKQLLRGESPGGQSYAKLSRGSPQYFRNP